MHRAVLAARPEAGAVVHLHSTHATAIACLAAPGRRRRHPAADALFRHARRPRICRCCPTTARAIAAMEPAIAAAAQDARAVLLANHGPVVSGKTLDDAVWRRRSWRRRRGWRCCCAACRALRRADAAQVDDLLATFG